MKKSFLLLAFVACSLFVVAQTPVASHGALHVSGTQLTDEHDKPVVLRGMSFGWHNWWPRFYNAGAVDWLAKDWEQVRQVSFPGLL